MNLNMLLFVGAIATSFAVGPPAAAGERQSNIVIAQAPPAATDKDKEKEKEKGKPHPPGKEEKGPVKKPVEQQQKKFEKPAQQQQHEQQKKPEKPAQQQHQQQIQKPAQQQQQQIQKPAQQQQQLQKPAQQQQPQIQKPAQQQPQQIQKPAQQQSNKPQQQQSGPAKPAPANPAAANRRLDQIRGERHETKEGNRTVIRELNRTFIRLNGQTIVEHDDSDRFRKGASNVHVERRGNDTVTTIVRPDGSRIITVVDARGRLLRRSRRLPNGREIVLIDNRTSGPAGGYGFIAGLAEPVIRIPRDRYIVEADRADRALLYDTLIAPPLVRLDRRYTLDEVLYTHALRERMRRIDLDTVTFDFGSWLVTPDQAPLLEPIADAIGRAIERNPGEVFLIEGHTDAVGSDIDNLSLSDRRAEAVAEILTQDFGIPPENLATQGYGEQFLKIPTQGPERRNRRVTVRRITPLLMGQN